MCRHAIASRGLAIQAEGIGCGGGSILNIRIAPCARWPDPGDFPDEDLDCIVACYVAAGTLVVEQDGRSAHLHPGDGAIYYSGRPCRLRLDDAHEHEIVSLKLPRGRLRTPGKFETATAISLRNAGAIGELTCRFIGWLGEEAARLDATSLDHLLLSWACLLEASLPRLGGSDPAKGHRRAHAVTLQRIKTHIRGALGDTALSPASVSSELGLSIRYLNRLFATEGASLGRYIWDQRLARAADQLADPALLAWPVTTVAIDSGFRNLSHFSRAFRKHYDMTPSEFRFRAAAATRDAREVCR